MPPPLDLNGRALRSGRIGTRFECRTSASLDTTPGAVFENLFFQAQREYALTPRRSGNHSDPVTPLGDRATASRLNACFRCRRP